MASGSLVHESPSSPEPSASCELDPKYEQRSHLNLFTKSPTAPPPPPLPPPLPPQAPTTPAPPHGSRKKRRVRSFYWKPIPEEKVRGKPNIWTMAVRQQHYQIDVRSVEELFGQQEEARTKSTGRNPRIGTCRGSFKESKDEVSVYVPSSAQCTGEILFCQTQLFTLVHYPISNLIKLFWTLFRGFKSQGLNRHILV